MIINRKKIIILIVGIFFSMVGWITWSPEKEVNYLIVQPQKGEIIQSITTTGEITASDLVLVGAQVSGQIKKMHVFLGQYVRQGDLIAEIDSTPQFNKVQKTKATLQMHQAQLDVKKVKALEAHQTYGRQSRLAQKGALAKEKLDKSKNAKDLAEAEVRELKAQVEKTQIELYQAEKDLAYTKIVAPIDGTVVSIPVKEGQTVNASQKAPTIVQLADLKSLELKMLVSEGDVTKVCSGMLVKFSILSAPKTTYTGSLLSIDPGPVYLTNAKDDQNKQEKEPIYYYGRVRVNNVHNKLQIGMTAQCHIICKSAINAITLPYDAVHLNGDQFYVLLQGTNGKIYKRDVEVGIQSQVTIEIVSGIAPDDNVVLSQVFDNELESKISAIY